MVQIWILMLDWNVFLSRNSVEFPLNLRRRDQLGPCFLFLLSLVTRLFEESLTRLVDRLFHGLQRTVCWRVSMQVDSTDYSWLCSGIKTTCVCAFISSECVFATTCKFWLKYCIFIVIASETCIHGENSPRETAPLLPRHCSNHPRAHTVKLGRMTTRKKQKNKKLPPTPGQAAQTGLIALIRPLRPHCSRNPLMLSFDSQVCHGCQICLKFHWILKMILDKAFFRNIAHRFESWIEFLWPLLTMLPENAFK